MKIYEVVSGGTKTHRPGGGEDWSVFVLANSPIEASRMAWEETEQGRPWVVYEWGEANYYYEEPRIIRGPFKQCAAVNFGWTAHYPDIVSQDNSTFETKTYDAQLEEE